MEKTKFNVIGVMSGTSLDGLDIALCSLQKNEDGWCSNILKACTVSYDNYWRNRLTEAPALSGRALVKLDLDYGLWVGAQVTSFIEKNSLEVDLIGSHGHTVFHQPDEGLTHQIGNGSSIHLSTAIPVVCDFRTTDVLLGGQGAPLVPIGDFLLYNEYEYRMNLGGFANISCGNSREDMLAFDICPMNIVMNKYANMLGKPYDDSGKIAKSGSINSVLLQELNTLPYYQLPAPKSLGKEWVDEYLLPIMKIEKHVPDALCTFTHHAAIQISSSIKCLSQGISTTKKSASILVSGGGAYNDFLLDLIKVSLPENHTLTLPDSLVIEYKEAEIFALLALLKYQDEPGNIKSVTGAKSEVPLGTLHNSMERK